MGHLGVKKRIMNPFCIQDVQIISILFKDISVKNITFVIKF